MSFLSDPTCSECQNNSDAERRKTADTECQTPVFTQYDLKNSYTMRAVVEQLIADSLVQLYERVVMVNTGVSTKYL